MTRFIDPMTDQSSLPLFGPERAAGFVEGAHNADALALIRRAAQPPVGAVPLAVIVEGAAGMGKTRSLQAVADAIGADVLAPDATGAYPPVPMTGPVLADAAERATGLALFALINGAVRARTAFVIAGAGDPLEWGGRASSPDLRSRLSAALRARVEAPGVGAMAIALQGLLAEYGLHVPQPLSAAYAARLQRRFGAVEAFAAAALAQAGPGISARVLLNRALADIPHWQLR